MLVFDIETGPQPERRLREFCPKFDESLYEHSLFDEKSVKIGNLKDPDKIKAKIEAAKELHEESMARLSASQIYDEKENFEKFKKEAPLSASYGMVVAIGFYAPLTDSFAMLDSTQLSEDMIIDIALTKIGACLADHRIVAGHNIFDFDLPFLIRRAWVHGLEVPDNIVFDVTSKWPKWHAKLVDTRKVWMMGTTGPGSKFSDLAAAFGTGGKPEGLDGSMFATLLINEPEKAMEYLKSDVVQPAEWLKKMGVV